MSMTTHRAAARSRWMGFATPAPDPTPTVPALSARHAAIVDEYDAVMRKAHPTESDVLGVFQRYINLDGAAVAAYRAARK